MANLNRGMFSWKSSIVSTTGGSTSIKTDSSKSQNFPGGGVGSRSSTVRHAIASRCEYCVSKPTPLEIASVAATAATTAESNALILVRGSEVTLATALQNAGLAAGYATETHTYAQLTQTATTTANRYGYYLTTMQNALLAYNAYINTLTAYDSVIQDQRLISAQAAIALINYNIANGL